MSNIQYSFPEFKFEKPVYNKQIPKLNGISKLFETPQLKKPNDLLSSNPFIRRQLLLDMNNMTFDNKFSNTTTSSVSATPYIGDDEGKSFADSELGRNLGNLFSSGLNSAGNTVYNNILKKTNLLEGMELNVGASVSGAAAGIAANYIGQGISSLGGDSMLSRGIGQGISTGLGTIGGNLTSSLFSEGSKGLQFSGSGLFGKTQAGAINPYALGASMIGTGLSAAFGPSKEYNGKYGTITKGMDNAYDAVQGAVGFIPGYGQGIAAAMALNKGLSNIFGSTDGMCVCAGTKVYTADGRYINIEDLKQEDGILGWNEKTHEIRPLKIECLIEPKLKECIEIELDNGRKLKCSIDHPILSNIKEKAESHTINGKRIAYRNWSFRRADELKVGNWVGLANNVDYWGTKEMPNAYLIGMLIGDGTYTYESSCKLWTADPSTWQYLEDNNLAVLIKQYTPENSNGKYSVENRDYRIINGMLLVKDLGIAYLKGKEKTLPKNIDSYNKESICKLIAGLFDTDGSFSGNKEKGTFSVTLYLSNLSLLKEVQHLLYKLGIISSINKRKASINKMKDGRTINSNESYRLELTDRRSILSFKSLIPINIDYKKDNLNIICEILFPKKDKDHYELSGARLAKITAITPIGILTVYNLTVSEDHTYLANDIITHNTKTDAILGSAFMPAPVKWLNMAGASKTGTFNNLSWLNSEKTTSFMGNAFGNLGDKFNKAREEAGKTYGTFSHGAKNEAQRNINFANNAWNLILAMADLDELQRIRSQYMTSINNLRYAQNILGGWSPLAIGKQGMKIFNNATNHNMGMRLLSAAALIDNKQMILSALAGTKLYGAKKFRAMSEEELRNRKPEIVVSRITPKTAEELKAEWERTHPNGGNADPNLSRISDLTSETFNQTTKPPFTGQEYLEAAEAQRLKKIDKFHEAEKVGEAALMADLAVSAAPLLLRGFRWVFNKARQLIKVPILKTSYSVGLPGYPYYYNPTTNQWDFSSAASDVKQGINNLKEWMNSPIYRKAAEANKAEAESMGLTYVPYYERPEYIRALEDPNIKFKNLNSSVGGESNLSGEVTINTGTTLNPILVVRHEMGHVAGLGKISEAAAVNPNNTLLLKELKYLRYKSNQVYKEGSEYAGQVDLNRNSFEGIQNARDFGEELGIKIGQEYPGYEKALEIVNSYPENGFKAGLKKMFRLDKEHMPYVWKALAGTLFTLAATLYNTNK